MLRSFVLFGRIRRAINKHGGGLLFLLRKKVDPASQDLGYVHGNRRASLQLDSEQKISAYLLETGEKSPRTFYVAIVYMFRTFCLHVS